MLRFNACFPIDHGVLINDFFQLLVVWRTGSPHSTITEKIKAANTGQQDIHVSNHEESFSTILVRNFEGEYCGARHTFIEGDGRRWVTEVVGKKSVEFWVSVKVYCDAPRPLTKDVETKKPYIVKQIVEAFSGGFDGKMPVGRDCILLRSGDEEIAKKVISGNIGCIMPIVYVSSTDRNRYILHPKSLSNMLAGMAHVVVEPSRSFSHKLRKMVNDNNVYSGAIGIYWPGEHRKHVLFQRFNETLEEFKKYTYETVKNALLSQNAVRTCSWSYVQTLKTKSEFAKLKNSGSQEVDKYAEVFDRELDEKKEALRLAEEENRRLRALLHGQQACQVVVDRNASLVSRGGEVDNYDGEFLDLLLDVISKQAQNTELGTRRRFVLDTILKANSSCGRREEIMDGLKSVLGGYKKMNAGVRSGLAELGFRVVDAGKHYKIQFASDDRIFVSLSTTSSDVKTGMNTRRDIIKQLL